MAKLKEEWKVIEGYPKYSVSNLGRVKTNRILKQTVDAGGFSVNGLTNEGVRKNFKTHRLVYEAFVGKVEWRQIVTHIDGNKRNNELINLRMFTKSNIEKEDVDFIRKNTKKLGGTMTDVELAKKYGVTKTAIFKIANGQSRVGG